MSTAERFDLVILGSGSAAFAAAIKAAELGARVAMTENRQIGGTCVNRGCIPSKNLIRAAEIYHSGNHRPFCGLDLAQQGIDAGELIAQKNKLVERLRRQKYLDIVEENERITLFAGPARFVARDRIRVGEEILAAPKFLVATGARPRTEVGIEGLSRVDYLTSDLLASGEPMELKTLPRSWVVIGGGFIACELGQMFRRLGAEMILLERGPRLLSGLDEEVADSLGKILEEEGVRIVFHARAVKAAKRDGQAVVAADVEGRREEFWGERLLLAAGVLPNTEGLALEIPGVERDEQGFIRVDEEMRTTAPHVWAAGDVTGPPLATPVGAREGVIAAENLMDEHRHKKIDRRAIPRAIFTDPEVASVGLTPEQARQQGYQVRANCLSLEHVPKAAAIRDTRGLVKMVIDAKTRRILGVHLIAHRGADLIHEAALAVKFGLTVEDLIETIHVYPTMSEAIRMAAQAFARDVSKLSCCAE